MCPPGFSAACAMMSCVADISCASSTTTQSYSGILNPSAAISHEFVVWIVDTNKGDVLTGYLRKDAADSIELVDSTGNVIALPSTDIAGRYKSNMSLMPNGLAAGMTAQELADVVAFLESLK